MARHTLYRIRRHSLHRFLHLSPSTRAVCRRLGLEDEGAAELVCDGRRLGRGELAGVEGQAERGLDAGAEGLSVAEAENTEVVHLGLDEGGVVEVDLGADLEVNLAVGGVLGVVRRPCAGLDVGVDAVVVRSRVGAQVAEAVQGDGVLGGVEAGGEVVLGDVATLDVVGDLTTGEEAVAAEDSVGGEDGALCA